MAYLGQWGNQLWQHTIAKVLADKTGQAYDARPWLDKSGRFLKWSMEPYMLPTSTPGQRDGVGPLIINADHWFDISNIVSGWEIEAMGFFQRYELIAPYRDRIRNDWLPIRCPLVPTDDDAVYIHVRRTDYLGDDLTPERNCQATTLEEYAACLKLFPDAKRVVIVSDDYDDPFIDELQGLVSGYHLNKDIPKRGTWDQDWLTLSSCRNLIMSQSTFSWWAAFLGCATKIVCPTFPGTFWGHGYRLMGPPKDGRDFPNLEVTDDPGKEWIWLHE